MEVEAERCPDCGGWRPKAEAWDKLGIIDQLWFYVGIQFGWMEIVEE